MDLPRAGWRTSSYSNIGGECVEVATAGGVVGIRDTKDRAGVILALRIRSGQTRTRTCRDARKLPRRDPAGERGYGAFPADLGQELEIPGARIESLSIIIAGVSE